MAIDQRIVSNVQKMVDQGAPTSDIDGYLQTEGLTSNQFKNAVTQPKDISWGETAKGFAKEILPGMLIRAPAAVISNVIDPRRWADVPATIAGGVASIPGVKEGLVALGEKPEVVEQAKKPWQQFVEHKAEQLGTIPRLKHTLATTPEAPVMDIASVALPFKPSLAAKAAPTSAYAEILRAGGKAIEEASAPELAAKKAINETKDATIKQSLEAGYVIPRSKYNPSTTTSALESVGGKEATGQQAAKNNQYNTDKLAREYLGLPADTAFSKPLMDDLLKSRAEPYREAASLPSVQTQSTSGGLIKAGQTRNGRIIVDEIKDARDKSRANWKSFNSGMGSSPNEALKDALAADAEVAKLENELEDLAQRNNKPDLLNSLRQSRQELAKIHTVEKAMNPATGEINAANFKREYNKNVPLTGQAKVIADFANAFPSESRLGSNVPAPDVSKLNAVLTGAAGAAGGASGGIPGGIMSGTAAYLAPSIARKMALSKALQKLPKYEQSMVVKMMKASPKSNPLALALYEMNNQEEQ